MSNNSTHRVQKHRLKKKIFEQIDSTPEKDVMSDSETSDFSTPNLETSNCQNEPSNSISEFQKELLLKLHKFNESSESNDIDMDWEAEVSSESSSSEHWSDNEMDWEKTASDELSNSEQSFEDYSDDIMNLEEVVESDHSSDLNDSYGDCIDWEEECEPIEVDIVNNEELNNHVIHDNCSDILEEPLEITELREWAVKTKIPKTHLDSLLKIFKKKLLPTLPSSYKTFLSTADAKYEIEKMTDSHGLEAEFVYLGIEEGIKACFNPELHSDGDTDIDFNIDGVKIKKSSSKTMWPGLGRIFYKKNPFVYKPFAIMIFYGNEKPKDVELYLRKFIKELNHLLKNGFEVESKKFSLKIRIFICDTPARALLKYTKGHTSFNGCEKCDTVARKDKDTVKTTVYLTVGEKRTDEDFRSFKDVDHHTGVSPLIAIRPKVDLVKRFILDPMHLLAGIMLRILENLMEGEPKVKLSASLKAQLNDRILSFLKDIPKEFKRKITSIFQYSSYKAVVLKFFLLYCGPLVLKGIVSDDLWKHFLLFHVACRMLASKQVLIHARLAQEYLEKFVKECPGHYGEKLVSLNVHNLNHLVDDVLFTQTDINANSAYPFESALGQIKSILLSPSNTLAQYCRRIHEERTILDLKAKLPKNLEILRVHPTQGILELKFNEQYFTTKHPNNTTILTDGSIVQISKIYKKNECILFRVANYRSLASVYKEPIDSTILNIFQIENKIIPSTKRSISINLIKSKVVKMTVKYSDQDKKTFVLPLLHT